MEKSYRSKSTSITQTSTGVNIANLGTNHKYKGVLHPDSLIWCHGSCGIEHNKVRKFIYPLYKYAQINDSLLHKLIICVCTNCNMTFYGESAKGISLSVPVSRLDSYLAYEVIVKINGVAQSIRGELLFPFRRASQEEITEDTRNFIDRVR